MQQHVHFILIDYNPPEFDLIMEVRQCLGLFFVIAAAVHLIPNRPVFGAQFKKKAEQSLLGLLFCFVYW